MTNLIVSRHPFGWDVLQFFPHLNRDDIFQATVQNGEGVEQLVQYMDASQSGLLETWAKRYISQGVTPLLATAIPLDNHWAWNMLSDPYAYFGERDGDCVREQVVQKLWKYVHYYSPPYVKRAMIAHIELGCRNYPEATRAADFSLCEWQIPDFGTLFMNNREKALPTLLETARQKAQLLVSILEEHKKQQSTAN